MQNKLFRRRPYRVECTGSLSTSEVKQRRARSVLGWGTAWEDLRVLSAFYLGSELLVLTDFLCVGPHAKLASASNTTLEDQLAILPRIVAQSKRTK